MIYVHKTPSGKSLILPIDSDSFDETRQRHKAYLSAMDKLMESLAAYEQLKKEIENNTHLSLEGQRVKLQQLAHTLVNDLANIGDYTAQQSNFHPDVERQKLMDIPRLDPGNAVAAIQRMETRQFIRQMPDEARMKWLLDQAQQGNGQIIAAVSDMPELSGLTANQATMLKESYIRTTKPVEYDLLQSDTKAFDSFQKASNTALKYVAQNHINSIVQGKDKAAKVLRAAIESE